MLWPRAADLGRCGFAEGLQALFLQRLGRLDAPLLDMAVAADLVGHAGQRHGSGMVGRR